MAKSQAKATETKSSEEKKETPATVKKQTPDEVQKETTKAEKTKERKFKVIALSVVGRGNRVYKQNETLLESTFERGEADKKVKEGFLEEIS